MSNLRWIIGRERLTFWCPGCDSSHQIRIRTDASARPSWEFNGDMERPTFSPSILVTMRWSENDADMKDDICHSFVRDGQIQFLGDCTHKMAGQTVPIPAWPYASGDYGGIEDAEP